MLDKFIMLSLNSLSADPVYIYIWDSNLICTVPADGLAP